MWILTKHGFFSAVCARQGNGTHGQPVDLDRIMVRVRLRGHLERGATRHRGGVTTFQGATAPQPPRRVSLVR
jgi:hypothetical protein